MSGSLVLSSNQISKCLPKLSKFGCTTYIPRPTSYYVGDALLASRPGIGRVSKAAQRLMAS